jgi:hypothetical protein
MYNASPEFLFGLSGIIQIESKSLEICQNSNKFNKNDFNYIILIQT